MAVIAVLTNLPDSESAFNLARELVRLRLAACANVLAGIFLIFPGVVSDLIALTLLLRPGPRAVVESGARRAAQGTLIEGEFRRTR